MTDEVAPLVHVPVLFQEVMEWLNPQPGARYIDGTIGLGGHAEGLLARSSPDGLLLGIDQDPQALRLAAERLQSFGSRVRLVQARHTDLAAVARREGFESVQGVLLDLGVSSLQLADRARGFSFREEGPLDMRMGPQAEQTAQDIVNHWSERDLETIIRDYGEEHHARRVARAIVQQRPFRTTTQLAAVVARAVGYSGKINPATRTFQALRITVNDELGSLSAVLPQAAGLLAPGGRLAVIAFHSLEDRIVKEFIVRESRDCVCPPGMPQCRCGHVAILRRLTKKPIRATEEEIRLNALSRSARLRVAERL